MHDFQQPDSEMPDTSVQVKTIDGIQPLDRQFGVYPRLSVPALLVDELFGQPQPTKIECRSIDGSASQLPQMRTFAVLDASIVPNLETLLGASTLDHACLFSGKAFEEYKDVAPWLVELEQDAQLTRRIFTQDEAPGALWDLAPGFFVRARVPLANMRRHLRKFTKLRDERGNWYYFRFWEATHARAHLYRVSTDSLRATHWFSLGPSERATIFVLDRARASMTVFSGRSLQADKPNTPFALDAEDRSIFSADRMRQFTARLDAHLKNKRRSFDQLSPKDRDHWLHVMIQEARQHGLKLEKSIADYAEAYVLLGCSPAADASISRHLNSIRHELDRARLILNEARSRTLTRM